MVPSVISLTSGEPSERIEFLRSNRYESLMLRFKLPLKLLLREMLVPPFNGFSESRAVPPLFSSLSLKFNSVMDTADGERCMESDNGMVVITSFESKPEAVVVIVGICVEDMGKMLKVPVVSVALVVTVKGNESVVIFVVTGISNKGREITFIKRVTIMSTNGYLLEAKLLGSTAWANAAVCGCPGIKVLFDDELSISLMGDRSKVPKT